MKTIYDVIVIGGGAAGMSAGIYSGRAKMKTLVLEQGSVGGQAKTTNEIVNYPGVRHTTGPKLMEEMHLQAEDFGVKFAQAEVLEAKLEGEIKVLKTTNGDYETRSVIIATGATPRTLGFPGEAEYRGRGVAYCATCDGEFYTGLEVFVIGAGFAAGILAPSARIGVIDPHFSACRCFAPPAASASLRCVRLSPYCIQRH